VPSLSVGEVELAYEQEGAGEPLILIMGIGAQMVMWDARLRAQLAARGFHVIRFDHRDTGASTRLDHLPVPRPLETTVRALVNLPRLLPVAAPYTLSDMARDVRGLCDGLGIDRAHVLGVSMGGMIAQHLAIEHPDRVKSVTSVMSTTGYRFYLPRPRAFRALLQPVGKTVDEVEERFLMMWRVIGSPGFPMDEARLRRVAREAFERGMSPRGFLRQLAAIMASGDRTRRLGEVRAPALVVHGREDPLIPVRAGRATARAIPGARYLEIPGMGHDLPAAVFPQLVDEVAALAERAARSGRAA
jgi:pimeloyl-ACP methyl ester carboxylesterase